MPPGLKLYGRCTIACALPQSLIKVEKKLPKEEGEEGPKFGLKLVLVFSCPFLDFLAKKYGPRPLPETPSGYRPRYSHVLNWCKFIESYFWLTALISIKYLCKNPLSKNCVKSMYMDLAGPSKLTAFCAMWQDYTNSLPRIFLKLAIWKLGANGPSLIERCQSHHLFSRAQCINAQVSLASAPMPKIWPLIS